jgi:hypothetical protein
MIVHLSLTPTQTPARACPAVLALLFPGLFLPCARPPPPSTSPCPPWPLPGMPRLWPHGGLHNIPFRPPKKGRQERALALDALALRSARLPLAHPLIFPPGATVFCRGDGVR